MKEKKNRLSKLSIVAFVIACFCLVSITTQNSQAQTLAMSGNTSFVGIIWSYFFPTANPGTSGTTGENPEPTPDIGITPTPTPTPTPTDAPNCGRTNSCLEEVY